MEKNDKKYSKPELFLEGKKVQFHTSREERLSMIHVKSNNKPDNIFSKKNRSFHFLAINMIIIFVLLIFFYTNSGKKALIKENNFTYVLSFKNTKNSKSIDFKLVVKNNSKIINKLNLNSQRMELLILNNKDMIIDTKTISIEKIEYAPNESYTNFIIIEKPVIGDYRAYLYLNKSKSNKVDLKFSVK